MDNNGVTAANVPVEGNDAQVGQEVSLTVGERLSNLENALSSFDALFMGLHSGVITINKEVKVNENDIKFIKSEQVRLKTLEKRVSELEMAKESQSPTAPGIDVLSTIGKQLMGPVMQDIAKVKTALAAFSNHIHLPDGRLGMPFTLKV